MYILVDYDNLEKDKPSDVSKGLEYVVDRLVSKVAGVITIDFPRIYVRLYGGWYDNLSPTKKSQILSAQANSKFKSISLLKDKDSKTSKVQVIVEVACSLISDPYKHFTHTLRKRPINFKLGCKHPINLGCSDPNCPMISVSKIINTGSCPVGGCSKNINSLFEKVEQKMVDTMISLDLEHLGRTYNSGIVVVSCDDDFLPALLVASKTKKVHHIRSHSTPPVINYSRFLGVNYIQLAF